MSWWASGDWTMSWLKKYADEIQSGAAILGVLVGIGGFWYTWDQLADANRALRASNTYEIQRDARELVDKLQANGLISSIINDNLVPERRAEALTDVWKMMNFYLSVYRQVAADGVSSEFAASFRDDFCDRFENTGMDQAWKELVAQSRLSSKHVTMRGDWCEKK